MPAGSGFLLQASKDRLLLPCQHLKHSALLGHSPSPTWASERSKAIKLLCILSPQFSPLHCLWGRLGSQQDGVESSDSPAPGRSLVWLTRGTQNFSVNTVHCPHLGQTLRPALGLYVRELPSVRTRSSALPSWKKVCPPTCRQCCVCPCGHQRAKPACPRSLRQGGHPAQPHSLHILRKEAAAGIPVLEFSSYTLPEPHSRKLYLYTFLIRISEGKLETSPLHTPTEKYKNTTMLVRRDIHLSPKSPYFLPSSLCHTNNLVSIVWGKVNALCHLAATQFGSGHWSSGASFLNCKMGNLSFLLEIICGCS